MALKLPDKSGLKSTSKRGRTDGRRGDVSPSDGAGLASGPGARGVSSGSRWFGSREMGRRPGVKRRATQARRWVWLGWDEVGREEKGEVETKQQCANAGHFLNHDTEISDILISW